LKQKSEARRTSLTIKKMIDYIFRDAEFMTAKDKELTFKQWKSFLKFLASPEWTSSNDKNTGSDYGLVAPRTFTDRIYKHLSLHCGFIAHYNIHGFYSTYFSGDIADLRRFFSHIESWGDTKDLTDAMLEEYKRMEAKIYPVAEDRTADKFNLIKEIVKRAETDVELRDKVVGWI
jgi:hypothetical protein